MTSGRTEWRGPAEVAAVGSESYMEISICGSESQNRFSPSILTGNHK